MSEKNFILGTETELMDGGLTIGENPDVGKTVLIIGTATQGPINTPVGVTDIDEAKKIFGPIYDGIEGVREETLLSRADIVLKGIDSRNRAVKLVRISNGETGFVEIKERAELATVPAKVAITISSLYPGVIYNQITVKQVVINGKSAIAIYNPITKETSTFPFVLNSNSDKDIKNVIQLVNMINDDPNMNSILNAQVSVYDVDTILNLASSDGTNLGNVRYAESLGESERDIKVDSEGKYFDLYLKNIFTHREDDTNTGYTKYDSSDPDDKFSLLGPNGLPINASSNLYEISVIWRNIKTKTVLGVDGLDNGNLPYPTQINASGQALPIIGTAKEVKNRAQIGVTASGVTTFTFAAYDPIDLATVKLERVTVAGQIIQVPSADFEISTVGGSSNENTAVLELLAALPENETLLLSYKSTGYALTQHFSLASVRATNNYKAYFMVGSRIFFGAQNPSDIEIEYNARKVYNENEVEIIDKNRSIVRVYDTYVPQTTQQEITQIALSWRYLPNWIDIANRNYSVYGATNGSTFNNSVKYNLLEALYARLSDYPVDIVNIAQTYADDTKIVESTENGLPIEVNAGFLQQLNRYIEGLAIGWKDAIGVMGVKPAYNGDIKTWVNKLTVPSVLDNTRAANIMINRDYKRCVVTAGTVLAMSDNRSAYITGIDGFVVAEMLKLPINKTLTNKKFSTTYSIAHPYYISSEDIKKINNLQYTTIRVENNGVIHIAEGFTASAIGSDYKKLSTLSSCIELANIGRKTIQPYVGEYFGDVQMKSLETQLVSAFGILTSTAHGEAPVRDIRFKLTQSLSDKKEGYLYIDYVLVPNFELTKVKNRVRLSLF